jgi:hypothetical protein
MKSDLSKKAFSTVSTSAVSATQMHYRFPGWKDASWNSFRRQRERYEVIRTYLGTNAVGAELGVYKGGFGEFLLPHCRKLYLVDPWYRLGGYWQSGLKDDSRVESLIEILIVYRAEINAGQVEVVVEYADKFLASMRDRWFDFVYIDSSHSYEQSKKELDAALDKIKYGGMLLGDDYDPDPDSNQYGVYRAVNEFVASHDVELVFVNSRQWGVRV